MLLKEFSDLFEKHIGCVKGYEHLIKLKRGAQPIVHKVRPVPLSIKKELKEVLDDLCMNSIIVPTESSLWVSPIVVARKKSGEIRLCADLRSLNKNIVVDCHPIPKIQELLANLGSAKVFSVNRPTFCIPPNSTFH